MTLNDLERRNSSHCVISPNLITLEADYVTMVEETVCRISSSTFDQNWPTLQRGLSAIAELLVSTSLVICCIFCLNCMFLCTVVWGRTPQWYNSAYGHLVAVVQSGHVHDVPKTSVWIAHYFSAYHQGRIKTLGAPCQSVMGALPFPSLPFPFRPFPPPSPLSPSPPSRPLFCHISPFLLLFLL